MKEKLLKILKDSSKVDWFIIHKFSKENFTHIKFSFVDNKERYDEPFKTNLGYITFAEEKFLDEYVSIIKDIIQTLKENDFALANTYILIIRTSFKRKNENILEKVFIEEIGKPHSKKIYELLANSLNENYYAHLPLNFNNYDTLNKWLEIFNSAQYLHDISDILFSVLFLVEVENFKKIEYEKIQLFNPLIRSRIISWYGTNIIINKEALLELIDKNKNEAAFFSALLIETNNAPDWIDREILEIFLIKNWDNIGKDLFQHLFGLSYRNKGKDFSELKSIIHSIFLEKIRTTNTFNEKWFNSLDFPDDFVALFSWIHQFKEILMDINEVNKKMIANAIIKSFNTIAKNFNEYIVSENNYFPFKSYQLNEEKYIVSLSYILLFISTLEDNEFEEIKNDFKKLVFKIKPQFYGNFRSQYLAKNFTEILLLILLSAINISNINEQIRSNIKELVKILNETLLIPYIHLTEREEEMWNKEIEKDRFQYKIGEYLINDYLKRIKNNENEIKECFKDLFELFDNVKVAEWIYER